MVNGQLQTTAAVVLGKKCGTNWRSGGFQSRGKPLAPCRDVNPGPPDHGLIAMISPFVKQTENIESFPGVLAPVL